MTITEAIAVNVLASWIIGREPYEYGAARGTPTDAEALEALEVLTGKANKALYAGWSPERLAELWPERRLR